MADQSPHAVPIHAGTHYCSVCGADITNQSSVSGKCSPCFFAAKNGGLPEEWKRPTDPRMEKISKLLIEECSPLKAIKHDSGKLPLSLLPSEALEEIAKVLAHGAEKYAAHNWRGGFVWSRTLDALLRHIYAWQRGEDIDPESGLNHLAHAGCNILFLLSFIATQTGEDDRYKICTPPTEMTGEPCQS